MPSYADVGLTDEEAAYQLAHIRDTKAPSIITSVVILSVLATIAVTLRLLVRWRTKVGFGADDYLITIAAVRRKTESCPVSGVTNRAIVAFMLGGNNLYSFWSVFIYLAVSAQFGVDRAKKRAMAWECTPSAQRQKNSSGF